MAAEMKLLPTLDMEPGGAYRVRIATHNESGEEVASAMVMIHILGRSKIRVDAHTDKPQSQVLRLRRKGAGPAPVLFTRHQLSRAYDEGYKAGRGVCDA